MGFRAKMLCVCTELVEAGKMDGKGGEEVAVEVVMAAENTKNVFAHQFIYTNVGSTRSIVPWYSTNSEVRYPFIIVLCSIRAFFLCIKHERSETG